MEHIATLKLDYAEETEEDKCNKGDEYYIPT